MEKGRIHMIDAVIVDAIRTATGKKKGSLSGAHPVDMLAPILKELVSRNDINAKDIEDVVTGCVTMTDEQGGNIARLAVLAAGYPVDVPAFSLNRMCGSSQEAIHQASQKILAGDADIAIACGAENMSRVPMGSAMGGFSSELGDRFNIVPQGFSAEMIASQWNLAREELDAFSLESHQKAADATDRGDFKREILPIDVKTAEGNITFAGDEGIRRNTSMEKLADLTPSFQPDD